MQSQKETQEERVAHEEEKAEIDEKQQNEMDENKD